MDVKVFLNDVQQELTYEQSNQIIQIMQSSKPESLQLITRNLDRDETGIQHEYVFDVNNTCIDSIFEASIAQKIKRINDHKCTALLVVTSVFIWWFCVFLFSLFYGSWFYIWIAVCLMWVAALILKHLSFNRVAFKLCIQTFDYWIKIGYAVIWAMCEISRQRTSLGIIHAIIVAISVLLVISYVSSFDAVNILKRKKLIVSASLSLIFLINAVMFQFIVPERAYRKISIQLPHGVSIISIHALAVNSVKILFIFFCKQTYKTWKAKGRATLILIPPKITWINKKKEALAMDEHISESVKPQITEKYDSDPKELNISNATKHTQKPRPERYSLSVDTTQY